VRLAKPAKEIDLRAVYLAVEPDAMFALHPQEPNPACPVGKTIQSALEPTLDAAADALLDSLGSTTVADIVRRVQAAP
jgi:DNA-binding IscR family transcriptional regulator